MRPTKVSDRIVSALLWGLIAAACLAAVYALRLILWTACALGFTM